MTWVIGMPGFLTRGVLVGDVRITLVDAERGRPVREFEGVRKIYPVAANMATGFAGNIDAGLRMVGDLAWNVRNVEPSRGCDQMDGRSFSGKPSSSHPKSDAGESSASEATDAVALATRR